jgi:hypothetical protein
MKGYEEESNANAHVSTVHTTPALLLMRMVSVDKY